MKFIKSFFFISSLIFTYVRYSYADSSAIDEMNLAPYIEILGSSFNTLKVEELEKQDLWTNAYSELGKIKMEYVGNWYRLKIGSWLTNGNWILVHPLAAHFYLYRKFGNQYIRTEHGFQDINTNRIIYRKTAILLDSIQVGEVLYFKIIGMSKRSSHHPLMESPNQFLKTVTHESPINFFFYSTILIVGLISLFAFFMLKEKIYLNYSLYLFSHIGVFLGIQGYAFQYFSHWSPAYSISFFGLVNLFIIMFVRELFEVKSKVQSGITLFISIVSLIFSTVSLFGFTNFAFEGLYSVVIATQFFIICFCLINAFLHHSNRLILIFISLSFFISSMGLINDRIYVPYSDLIDAAYQPIALVEILLFGFMLLRRFYFINVERKKAVELARLKTIESLQLEAENQKLSVEARIGLLAGQVSHDIRSPLSALNMIVASLPNLPEEHRSLIRSAIQRINDIANSLLQKSKNMGSDNNVNSKFESQAESQGHQLKNDPMLIYAIVDSLVSEKRMEFANKSGLEILPEFDLSEMAFAAVSSSELKRVSSNLINNSVEAIDSSNGKIEIRLSYSESEIFLKISDNGRGIPEDVLSQLKKGTPGVSYGKSNNREAGTGIGVSSSRAIIESFGGKFEIQSQVSVGTTITITLPKVQKPDWILDRIQLKNNQIVVVLDDDYSIHHLWQERLAVDPFISKGVVLKKFASVKDFEDWYLEASHQNSNYLFLIDYELIGPNKTENGLNLIIRNNLVRSSILVTSRFDESEVIDRCKKLNVPLLPKLMAGFVRVAID